MRLESNEGPLKKAPLGQSAWEKAANLEALLSGRPTSEDVLQQPLAERDPIEGLTLEEFMNKYSVARVDQITHGYTRKDGHKRLTWLIDGNTPQEWEKVHSKEDLPRWHH